MCQRHRQDVPKLAQHPREPRLAPGALQEHGARLGAPVGPQPGQHLAVGLGMALVQHGGLRQSHQGPAQRAQAHAQLGLLVGGQREVGQVAGLGNGAAPVQPAAAQLVHLTRRQQACGNARALTVGLRAQMRIHQVAAHCGHPRVRLQPGQCLLHKAGLQQHVGVEHVDEVAARMTPAQLHRRAAAALRRLVELHDAHRISPRQRHRAIGRDRIDH